MKSKTAFTKRDLIVFLGSTIFLLANLGAIGSSGRRRAKEAVCLSNLRQWGSVFQMYAQDNDGYFHEGWAGLPNCSFGREGTNWWMHALKPYYKNQDLCLCPEAVRLGVDVGLGEIGATFFAWSALGWIGPTGSVYGSYGINGWVENNQCEDGDPYPHLRWRTPNVAGGANIPLFLDAPWVNAWPQSHNEPPDFDDQDWRFSSHMGRFCINRHNGCVNIAFLDFSARKVGLKELWKLKWHRQYDTCGPWTKCGGIQPEDWPEWMRDFQDY